MELIKYNINFNNYVSNQNIKIKFNSISFWNNGDTIATINNVPIPIHGTLAISGNAGEYCEQEFYISFANPTDPLNKILVTIKEYAQ